MKSITGMKPFATVTLTLIVVVQVALAFFRIESNKSRSNIGDILADNISRLGNKVKDRASWSRRRSL